MTTGSTASHARAAAVPVETDRAKVVRVGLLMDGYVQPAWVDEMLAECWRIDGVVPVVIVMNTAPTVAPSSRWRAWIRNRRVLLFALYRRIDDRRLKHLRDPFAPVDLQPRLAHIPRVNVVPRQTKYSDFISEDDVEQIKAYAPDVLLRLGFRILQGPVLSAATYGIWSYHHGDNRVNRGGPAGIWESLMGNPITGSTLQIITPELDGGRVIHRGAFATQHGSGAANRARLYWRSSHFVPTKLRDLQLSGADRALQPADGPGLSTYSQPLYRAPTNTRMASLWLSQVCRRLGRGIMERLTRTQWFLAYRFNPPHATGPDLAPFRFRELIPPRDRIWADPFPVACEGRHYLFFEEKRFGAAKGHISAIELGKEGPIGEPRVVLDEPHHVSYPFLLQWQGEHFMVPEACASRRLSCYRATEFPWKWEYAGVLINEPVLDATLVEIEGRWWMFASPKTADSDSDELLLYHAPTPLGPWQPHRNNPVKSSALGSRPAGRVFRHEGHWYRPAQICAPSYGKAIRFFRITRLDESSFEEVEAGELLPEWKEGLTGTHTINCDAGLTVIDVRRSISRLGAILGAINFMPRLADAADGLQLAMRSIMA